MATKKKGRPKKRSNIATVHAAERVAVRGGRQGKDIERTKEGLSPAHAKVVHYYLTNGMNRKKALLSAGYSNSVANTNAHQVFDRPEVQKAIARRIAKMEKKFEVTEDFVTSRLAALADANVGAILEKLANNGNDLSILTKTEKYQLSEIVERSYKEGRGENAETVKELKIKTESRKGALDSLARTLGMFKDKIDLTDGTQSIVTLLQQGRQRTATGKKENG